MFSRYLSSLSSGGLIILFLPDFLGVSRFLHLTLYLEVVLVMGKGLRGPRGGGVEGWRSRKGGLGGCREPGFHPAALLLDTVALGLPWSPSLPAVVV